MNNIFKTIWNKSTQSWVAVSELARGYVKSSSDKTSCRISKIGSSKFHLSFITLSILISASPEIVANNHATTYGVISGGNHNIAIGNNSKTGDTRKPTNQSIAIGSGNGANDGAQAKGDQSIAIGGNTIAEGHSSIAIGGDDVDKAINERIGYTDNNGGSVTDKLGTAYTSLTGGDLLKPSKYTSSKSGHLGIALGVKAVASNLSLALGTNAQASKTNTLAIGAGAIAALDNSVAIGGGASTEGSLGTKQQNTTIEGTLFSWAGGDNVLKGDIVTFGKQGFERQLKNIAPGKVSADSTDAINGSQLYSITQVLTKRSQRDVYVHVNTGVNTQEAGNNSTNAGQIDSKGGATGTKSATLGVNAKATAENAIAIGTDASANYRNSVALGQGATTSAVATDNLTLSFKDATYNNKVVTVSGQGNEEKGSISFGSQGKERQLQNVAAGRITATSTDAINGSQLYHVAKNLGFNVYENNTAKSRINNDNIVKFSNGDYTTAVVTPENGNAKVTFNVNVTEIANVNNKATVYTVSGSNNGLAKTSEVVKAINNSGFMLKSSANANGHAVTNGDSVTINKGNNIDINQSSSTITIKTVENPSFTSVNLSPQTGNGVKTPTENQAITKGYLDDQLGKFNFSVGNGTTDANNKFIVGKDGKIDIVGDGNITTKVDSSNSKITLGLNPSITDDIAKIDTIESTLNKAEGNIQNLTTGLDSVKDKLNKGLTFKGDNTSTSNEITLGNNFSILGEGPISTKAENDTLKIKIQDNSITSDYLASNSVTTDKIADSNVTLNKLGNDVKNEINSKEESVEATENAKALGLTVTPNSVTGKGNKFSIDLIENTLINKLSSGANITNPTTSNPRLITDKALNAYLTTNPIKLTADSSTAPIADNKLSLGQTLSIKGSTNGFITTSVVGSSFTLDLNQNTKDKISKIGIGTVSNGDQNTVTGDAVSKAINAAVNDYSFTIEKQWHSDNAPVNVGKVSKDHKINFKEGHLTSVSVIKDDVSSRTTVVYHTINQDVEYDNATGTFKAGVSNIPDRNGNSQPGATTAEVVAKTVNKALEKTKAEIDVVDGKVTAVNTRVETLEKGWEIGDATAKVKDIKATNRVDFIGSDTIGVTVESTTNGANVTVSAKTHDLVVSNDGTITSPSSDDGKKLVTAKSVADAINSSGWFTKAEADAAAGGMLEGASTKEKVVSGDTVTFKSGKNLKIKQEGKTFTYSTADDVTFTNVTATNSLAITGGPTLSTTGLDMAGKKINNLVEGTIADNSNEAITGKQLKDLADKLGITPTNTSFTEPNFNSIRDKNSNNGPTPTSFKDALDKVIEGLNRGVTFGGDQGNSAIQYLGSTYNVKAAANNISANGKTFVGKNLHTKYTNQGGDGLLSIGLSETPDFKSVTLSDGGNQYLTLGKDANENGGKITGLTNRNATNNADYGTNGNDSRAATEGAVKEISDRIKQSDNTSPFIYADEKGNPVTKATDGKFYPKDLVNSDGTPKIGSAGKEIDPSNIVVKTKNDTPLPITNVRSGLGLDGNSKEGLSDGTPNTPKTISVEKAQKIIAGDNLNGNGGLLTKTGVELNKVATIGDLQALAQAGLDFLGNKGDVIHRPLGTKLAILGKDVVQDLNGYSSENLATETTNDNKLYIRFKEKPEFKSITVKDSDNKHHIQLDPTDGLVVKATKDDTTPVKITSSGIDAGDSKITNLVDGTIADKSKDAVTGNQLKNLADKLGIAVKNDGSGFEEPTFTAIKGKDGNDKTTLPTTLKNAVDNIISTLNDGLTFGGDLGSAQKQYLGSTFDVKAAANDISDKGKTFVGKNLKTSYTNTDGNGVLSIGLSDTPEFTKVTIGTEANPFITLEKDKDSDSGKITGLTNRTTDSNDYGTDDNAGRAATEGAVKKLSDAVNLNNDSSPMMYADAQSGEKLVKGKDDKFYKPSDLEGATYDPVTKTYTKDNQNITPVTDVVVKSKDLKPMTNVASGLSPEKIGNKDVTDIYEQGKGIKTNVARELISGNNGLLSLSEPNKLNKVATIGDLQAAAQAGLTFVGNNQDIEVHRPLGTALNIKGGSDGTEVSARNVYVKGDKDSNTLTIEIKEKPQFKGIDLNTNEADSKSISMTPDKEGTKLTLSTSAAGKDSVTLDGLENGKIAETSKEAVTGSQLKDLAKNLGVDVKADGKGFTAPTFTPIKSANSTDSAAPTTLKEAIDKTIEAVNRGLSFAGDEGNGNQNLGSTFNVKSTNTVITKDNKTFVGKNITTKYEKDANGNGTLSIGISEKPDFEAVTLTKKGETTPFLTIGEDTENTDKPTTGKITGLTARDLGSKGYGVGDNVGRAATEGAVKDLYDKVKSNEGSSPFEYRDTDNNKLVKVGDKYYSEKDLAGKYIVDGKIFDKPVVKDGDKYYEIGPDGKRKLGPDGQPLATDTTTANITEKEPATASNKKLTDISNVASGLGLPGKYTTDPTDNGSKENPKPITTEDARKVIAGDTKDGKGGLYTKEGKDLNKVATIGDLQAVAKAGLTFKGNNTDAEVHRPLGTTLDIKGEATESTGTSGKNVYVEANANDNSLTVKIKETPEFKGLELKDGNTNAIKFTPSDVANKDNPAQKEPVLTLSSGTGADNKPGTVKLSGISNGDISPTSKDAVNGSQVFALSRGEIPKTEDKHITITQPDGSTTVIDAKNVIVDEKGNPLLKTYNVQGQGEHIENSVISAISNMNTEGIKFFHTNDGRNVDDRPKVQGLNDEDSSAGGVHSTAVGYRANAAGENGVAFGFDAVAGKILEEKEATITEVVNGKTVEVKRKVRVVEAVKNAIAIGAGARASNDNTISIGSGNQVNGKNSGAIGDPSYIDADNAYAIGNNNKIDATSEKTFVLGNEVTVTTARSVFLGDAVGYVAADNKAGTTKGKAEYSEQKIGETTYKYAGGKANEVVGVVSVGNVKQDGTMETRRIQNVAPGLISDKSTDAINGSQLYAVMDSGWNLKAEEVDGTSGKVTKGKADTTKVSIGKTVKVRAGNNVEIAHNKDESIDISTSMAPTFNSLNVNPGGTVNMGGNRVQNVGNAVEAGDAVNYGQFKTEVGKLDSRLQAGIAGAVASGTLVQAFNPNESLVAVGAGTYRGKSAVALGYSRVSDNGKIIIKVTGSTNTYGDVTGGASVGYKF
ncbi:autotransporter adhesin [Pasteurella multocida]|nr:autotransporter adhesin [Pasteurella multocida]